MNDNELQSLKITLVDINNEIKNMLHKQEDLHSDIKDVKSAIYNPDSGLYARIRDLDERIKDLESWQNTVTKVIWTISTTVTGLVVATIYKLIT
jgi:archaellum component FlaC|tara:strand:+ start:366 stop:647 length:282 start_codon:yes stop_codon:yes gene_type:complete